MKEPNDNINFVCDKHAPKKINIPKKDYENLVGGFVKATFKAIDLRGRRSLEHMWVKVESVDVKKKTVTGLVDNDPVYACFDSNDNPIKHKSEVTLNIADLVGVVK